MTDSTPVVPVVEPQLEYAATTVVGDMSLSRIDGVTTITVRAGWRRLLSVGWPWLATVAYALLFAMVRSYIVGVSVGWTLVANVVGFTLVISSVAGIPRLIFLLRGHRWVASSSGLEFTGRKLADIIVERYPRELIGDLQVKRVRIKNQPLKRRFLVIVKPDGNNIAISSGTREELDFACEALKEAMHIPGDPFGASLYPKRPRWSRVQYRAMAGGVVATLYPSKVGLDGLAAIILILPVPSLLIAWLHSQYPAIVDTTPPSGWGIVFSALFNALAVAGLLRARYKMYRTRTLMWNAGELQLIERSIFNPCLERWKLSDPSLLVVTDNGRKSASLGLKKDATESIALIDKGPSNDVLFVHQLLTTAISLPRAVLATREQGTPS